MHGASSGCAFPILSNGGAREIAEKARRAVLEARIRQAKAFANPVEDFVLASPTRANNNGLSNKEV